MGRRLEGRGAAPGVALAPVSIVASVSTQIPLFEEIRTGSIEAEEERLRAATMAASGQLHEMAQRMTVVAGEEEAEIFEAHAEFAEDPELFSQASAAIRAGASAERAVTGAFDTFRELLSASASEYRAERVADLDDVRDRVVAILCGIDIAIPIPAVRSVIVAAELTPSQTADIPRELIAAIVTESGSPTSHAAILARSLGIPAVVSCHGLLGSVEDGTVVAVDGRTGAVIVEPDQGEIETIENEIFQEQERRARLDALRDEPGRTRDGRSVELAANIGSAQDLKVAQEAGAEGSGLVRTEFLFLGRRSAPSVEEQARFYSEVLSAFPGSRVVFRTLDVGADKPLPFVDAPPEENPALGFRGLRMSLASLDLFRDQLKALLRARSEVGDDGGRMAIMFPMVSVEREFLQARDLLTETAGREGHSLEGLEIGVMVEVPSAALAAERLARYADFLSIGTNDLLQYLFAADRLNGAVADLADACEPVALRTLGDIIAAGHAHGAWVGVCGEAASDPTVAAALVGLGADELSMTRVAIPEVKDLLRRLDHAVCERAVAEAIDVAREGAEARAMIEAALGIEALG